MERLAPLPIDAHLKGIVETLDRAGTLVLTAPPGTGKTTRVPRALLDAGFAAAGKAGEILVLEPRRLAVRLAAARVAEELGEPLGQTVGYSIRFENVGGPGTRIRFLTEAILARRLAGAAPRRSGSGGASVIILDEFHERHIDTDLALALAKRARRADPGLKVLVMSATLDAAPVAAYLGGAPVVALDEPLYGISVAYEEKPDNRPLHEKVRGAVLGILRSGTRGDVLVFLPGAAEIRRAAEALLPVAQGAGLEVVPLHGDLPAAVQRRALAPSDKVKVILSTNVAESSVTIPGIAAVIDSGLCRRAGHSAWSGLPTLQTAKISKAAAAQRAGRAGRTQAGVVLRLYSRADYNARPPRETPEILRADLAETALLLHGAGCGDLAAFDWFERPSDAAIAAADGLLQRLGAVDGAGGLTAAGRRMSSLPTHPRVSRLILDGAAAGVFEESVLAAALLSERDIRLDARATVSRADAGACGGARRSSGRSDLLELADLFREAEAAGFHPERLRSLGLDPGAVHAVRQAHRQLTRLSPGKDGGGGGVRLTDEDRGEALGMAVLAAFPDRVARRRKKGDGEVLLSNGGAARLAPSSVVHGAMFLVAADAEEKKDGGLIRLASAIEVEWLAEMFPEKVVDVVQTLWNDAAKRVEESRRTLYEGLVLEEAVRPAPCSEETSRVLADALLARGVEQLSGYGALEALRRRLALLARTFPGEGWPEAGDGDIRAGVRGLCRDKRSLAEVEALPAGEILLGMLSERQRARLAKEAPERVALSPKRSVRIHYEADRPPWIESRLQDFFGMGETPRICSGRVPLTVHLLAPNQRAVQVTQDLGGFWTRHYPAIRRELMRRYPKHAWPEL
ncbi:MAG: ATP-dependent helicase HrpB [Acidobacteriota bacterium]|jgi:ATP-dependent helicase HrpB|nr:ATP-dependent helicase HrpB [Acidobacteriota bacterium]